MKKYHAQTWPSLWPSVVWFVRQPFNRDISHSFPSIQTNTSSIKDHFAFNRDRCQSLPFHTANKRIRPQKPFRANRVSGGANCSCPHTRTTPHTHTREHAHIHTQTRRHTHAHTLIHKRMQTDTFRDQTRTRTPTHASTRAPLSKAYQQRSIIPLLPHPPITADERLRHHQSFCANRVSVRPRLRSGYGHRV